MDHGFTFIVIAARFFVAFNGQICYVYRA